MTSKPAFLPRSLAVLNHVPPVCVGKGGGSAWPVKGAAQDYSGGRRQLTRCRNGGASRDRIPAARSDPGGREGPNLHPDCAALPAVAESYMVIPLGESDHAGSPHFDDQAQKLFSKGQTKPTFFGDRKALEKHVSERRILLF
jgi:acyl-homoserine lactone acylase PvdQ